MEYEKVVPIFIAIFIFASLCVAGYYIKKSKNVKLIAGFDAEDETIDKEYVTRKVGNGLIYIGLTNLFIFIFGMIIKKVFDCLPNGIISMFIVLNTFIAAAFIIYNANKKK